jgi:hypothetical protein
LKNISIMACGDLKETPQAGMSVPEEEDAEISLAMKKSAASVIEEEEASEAEIARRGGEACVRAIASLFGADVFTQCPALKPIIIDPIVDAPAENAPAETLQTLVNALQMIKVSVPWRTSLFEVR